MTREAAAYHEAGHGVAHWALFRKATGDRWELGMISNYWLGVLLFGLVIALLRQNYFLKKRH
jgi:hypothetical protein